MHNYAHTLFVAGWFTQLVTDDQVDRVPRLGPDITNTTTRQTRRICPPKFKIVILIFLQKNLKNPSALYQGDSRPTAKGIYQRGCRRLRRLPRLITPPKSTHTASIHPPRQRNGHQPDRPHETLSSRQPWAFLAGPRTTGRGEPRVRKYGWHTADLCPPCPPQRSQPSPPGGQPARQATHDGGTPLVQSHVVAR